MRLVLIAVVLAGCSFDTRIPLTSELEAGVPTEGAEGCTAWTFMPKDFDPCAIAAPMDPPALFTGIYLIDSDTGMMRGSGGPFQLAYKAVNGVGIVSFTGLVLQANVSLRAEGTKPLVIASWSSMQIDGSVDVSSNLTNTGAGANPATCGASFGGNGMPLASGDGGGGGGGFGGLGGLGGNGNNVAATGGAAGMTRALPALIEGGCRGGNARVGDGGNPGDSGNGGGGIALVAKETLSIAGTVHAGGAGGTGGAQSQTGGGGGGSGGMIRVEGAMLVLSTTTVLAANGGQGGGGCDNSTAGNGASGVAGAAEAAQGNSQGAGTDGGGGGWRDRLTGNAASQSSDGGGGGGGGVGYVVYKAHANATGVGVAIASPPAQPF